MYYKTHIDGGGKRKRLLQEDVENRKKKKKHKMTKVIVFDKRFPRSFSISLGNNNNITKETE